MDRVFRKTLESLVEQLESKKMKVARVQKELHELIDAASSNAREYEKLTSRFRNNYGVELPQPMPKRIYVPKAQIPVEYDDKAQVIHSLINNFGKK